MRRSLRILILLFFIGFRLNAQNAPVFYVDSSIYLVTGSGLNQLLIASISDGDGAGQDVQLAVESSNTDMLTVGSVQLGQGGHFALVQVTEQGVPGSTRLFVSLTDADGTSRDTIVVDMGPYRQSGMNFEIHDAVFWQEVVPVNGTPIYTQLIPSGEGPYATLDYSKIPITVNMDCGASPPCNGHDFYTAFYRGYFVPAVSGEYRFTMRSQDAHGFWLSTDSNPANAKKIVYRGKDAAVGTTIGNDTESAIVNLLAGKVYAFYGTQWIIHSTFGGVLMSGPGIAKAFLPGNLTFPVFDPVRPIAPSSISLTGLTSTSVLVNWNNGTDNIKLTGYNIYLDGRKLNSSLISGNSFSISGLAPDSVYAVSITSNDKMGNESYLSTANLISTYPEDLLPPQPPDTIETIHATGLALSLRWSGAVDNETAVVGYKVFLNGLLYNTGGLLFSPQAVITGLIPETTYGISLVAVDAGMNESAPSDTFQVRTSKFDPLGSSLGEKRARVKVVMKNISWTEGIGLNGPYEDGSMVNNAQIKSKVRGFLPGAIRWGGISANSKSLAGSSGTGKANTYAKMLNFANQMGAYFALTVGVQDGLDYRTDLNTFTNLIEYLAGPASSTWGAKRAAEGYTEPLLQKGKGILLEFGNEVWGASVHDAQIGADYLAYGKWCRDAAAVVRSSPYYDPEKISMVYSGRNPRADESYELNNKVMTGDTGQVECLAVSGYLGGNMNYDPDVPAGKTEIDYYILRIAQAANNCDGLRLSMQDMLKLTGTVKPFYLYESNATTSSYNGRLGQAIVMTDYLASTTKYGSIVPSLFHLTGGEWRMTLPSEGYKSLPLYDAGRLFNRFGKGHVLQTSVETNDFITNGFGSTLNWSPVGAYASNTDTSFTLILFSRDFENDYTVQLDLPDQATFGGKARKYLLTGSDWNTREAVIDSMDIDLNDSLLLTVPKYSMLVLRFSGENPGFTPTEMGYYDRKRPTSVTITPESKPHITVNREKLTYLIDVQPADAFYKGIAWVVEPNALKPIVTPSATRISFKGSGACNGNGIVNFSAYALDNKNARSSYALSISNQGLNCGVGVEDLNSSEAIYYPNPANDLLYVRLAGKQELSILDMTGRLVKTVNASGLVSISVSDLHEGIYLVKCTSEGELTTGKLIISR